ncbi:MAG: glycosyltransferase family 4 protein [Thermoflexibacteraceae bacterium]
MKVCISLGGRFHAFYLAKYLQEQGCLYHLCTSYPKFEVAKYGIDTKKVSTVVSKEIVERGYRKIMGRGLSDIYLCNWFDYWASKQIPLDADIYIIWSSFALKTIRQIRKHNPHAIIILERGSTHIIEQRDLLEKGGVTEAISQAIIDKEVAEYQAVDRISTISLFAKKSFLKHGFIEKNIFVNNMGVDLQEFPFIDRKIKNTDEPFMVGYVGVMNKRKNIQGLIKAVEVLVQKKYAIKLLLVGGIDTSSFDTKLLGKDFIIYHPSMLQRELYKVYTQMDVFVLNSIEDGFGMVLLQAMSSGLPVIATTNTGAPDVVLEGKNGFIIPIEDEKALADKILSLYNHREKTKEMGIEAHQTVSNGFSWEDYGQRYLQFLQKLSK